MTRNAYRVKKPSVIRRIKNRFNKTKIRHNNRKSNAYPSADKPVLRFFTPMNFALAIVVLMAFSVLGQLYWFTAGVYVDTFYELSVDSTTVSINLGSEAVSNWPVIGLILSAPLGWAEGFVNSFETSSAGLAGLALYVILQTGELLPTIIWESPELMFWLIRKFESHNKISVSSSDSTAIKKLKIKHNEYYDSFLNHLEDFRLICYCIDVTICFFLVKFVHSGAGLVRFMEAVRNLTFGLFDLDPTATFRVICSLFLLWFALKLTMRLTRGFRLFAKRVPNVQSS